MGEVVEMPNRYDKRDRVKRVSAMVAGRLNLPPIRSATQKQTNGANFNFI